MNITITLTAEETLSLMENGSLANFIKQGVSHNTQEVAVNSPAPEPVQSAPTTGQDPMMGMPQTTSQGMDSFTNPAQGQMPQQAPQQQPMGMPQGQPAPMNNQPPMGMPPQGQPVGMQGYPQGQQPQYGQPQQAPQQQPMQGQPMGMPQQAPQQQPTGQTPQGGQAISLDEMRMKLWEISKAGKDVNTLLNNFGAVKIEDLDPSRYSDFLSAAQNL